MAFRFLMQPVMAMLLGFRDGRRDAREFRPAFLWSILTNRKRRLELLKDAVRSVAKILILALLLDGIYQLIVFKRIYPLEAVAVAITVALLPYLLIRGITGWFGRR